MTNSIGIYLQSWQVWLVVLCLLSAAGSFAVFEGISVLCIMHSKTFRHSGSNLAYPEAGEAEATGFHVTERRKNTDRRAHGI